MFSTIILERIHSSGVSMFKSFSNVKEFYDKPRSEILKVIKNFEVIVIKSTIKIDHEFLNNVKPPKLKFYEISTEVNNPAKNDPSIINPVK